MRLFGLWSCCCGSGGSGVPADAILDSDGQPILDSNGDYILDSEV